ncbi:MAG: Crp/Fnr family transcriptional regulator [Silicimonas sp.]|nr:Crp/Fnr family transcriptional regulator [Silicimonas sp.]
MTLGQNNTTTWLSHFPGLLALPPDLQATLTAGSEVINVPAGDTIFQPGEAADRLLLLLDGTILVRQKSETGRDVTLYRVSEGDSCILTTACVLTFEDYSAEGTAETDVRAVAIPRETFDDMLARSKLFREFIFRAYSQRITDLFSLVDDIVFQRMDVRLAARLLELADDSGTLRATHQTLASELGTAREVISRTMAEFQRRAWVEQSRGVVRLTAREELERMVRKARDT